MQKFTFVLLTMVALLSLTGATFAQDMDDMPCLGLEQEDCDLYYDLAEPDLPESASFDLSNDVAVSFEGETFNVAVEANGSYIYDVSVVEDYIESIADTPLIDATLGDFVGYLESGINAFDANLSLVITAPDQFAPFLPMENIPVDLWLVEGDAYADLSLVGQLAGDPAFTGVLGINLFEFVYFALEEVTVADLAEALEDIDDIDFDAETLEDFQAQLQTNLEAQSMDPEAIEEFVMVERLEDAEIDGVEVAVFETTIDFAALFGSDLIREIAMTQLDEEDFEGLDITPDDVFDALQASIGEDTSAVTVESYGLEDGYLYASETDLFLSISPEPINELTGEAMAEAGMETTEEPDAEPAENIEIEVSSVLSRSDFNAVEEIVLPEDAEVVPLEDLMDALTGEEAEAA